MKNGPITLPEAVKTLRKYYGKPATLESTDPFELILLENVAYLATPEKRRKAFDVLKGRIGTDPGAIMNASREELETVTSSGALKSVFAAKLRECALIALSEFDGDLSRALKLPLSKAKKALRLFPGIGEPGAEKILMFTGVHPFLAPESNGVRVLGRLGLIKEEKSYARMYAACREVGQSLGADPVVFQDAHLLLQQHGRTLCKRNKPFCERCPLRMKCAYAIAVFSSN